MDISLDLSELINNIKADHAIIINDTVTEANLPPLLIYQNTRELSQVGCAIRKVTFHPWVSILCYSFSPFQFDMC